MFLVVVSFKGDRDVLLEWFLKGYGLGHVHLAKSRCWFDEVSDFLIVNVQLEERLFDRKATGYHTGFADRVDECCYIGYC